MVTGALTLKEILDRAVIERLGALHEDLSAQMVIIFGQNCEPPQSRNLFVLIFLNWQFFIAQALVDAGSVHGAGLGKIEDPLQILRLLLP